MNTARPKRPLLFRFALVWLAAIAGLVVLDWLSPTFDFSWLTRLYFWVTLAMSVVAFAMFGIDKRRAQKEQYRISEKQLHLMALFGGWPGAVVGQQLFRHKTVKLTFRMVLWTIIAAHVAVSAWFTYRGFAGPATVSAEAGQSVATTTTAPSPPRLR